MTSVSIRAILARLDQAAHTSPETAPVLDRLWRDRKRHHLARSFSFGYTCALQDLRSAVRASPRATPEALLDHLRAAQRADDLDLFEIRNKRWFLSQQSLDEDHASRLGYQALITLYTRMIHEPA